MSARGVHFAVTPAQTKRLLAAKSDRKLMDLVEEIEEAASGGGGSTGGGGGGKASVRCRPGAEDRRSVRAISTVVVSPSCAASAASSSRTSVIDGRAAGSASRSLSNGSVRGPHRRGGSIRPPATRCNCCS